MALDDYLRIGFVLAVTLAFVMLMGLVFGRHFLAILKDIIQGPKREFQSLAGIISFLGFILFVYLLIHKEAMDYLIRFMLPRSEQLQMLAHSERAEYTLIWAALAVILGNFVLLGILGLGGGRRN